MEGRKDLEHHQWKMLTTDEREMELRRAISTLEWDITNIRNDEIKVIKEKRLQECKKELQELSEKNE